MKKIIDGKRYDTETATKIGTANYGYGGDFAAYCESLYMTKLGNYFLAGSGGPMSKYSEPAPGGGFGGGFKIIPMTRQEALEWAQNEIAFDKIEKHFGDMLEDA